MIYKLCCSILCFGGLVIANAQTWQPDILGEKYNALEVYFADDYSGKVKSTVIRQKCEFKSQRAVLYIHGYNDYFFQKELGDNFVNNGYNFYAVDLRKYGRSILPGQTLFEVRDLTEYFEDINAALDAIINDGNTSIVFMGHSTGGLIASYYLAETKHENYPIKALVLNSPFLDMNLDVLTEDFVLPIIGWCASLFPDLSINQGGSNLYARTLLKQYEGEWEYNTRWKLEWPQDVTMGWLKAITQAQNRLHRGADINIPILLMRSDKSGSETELSVEEARKADIVLDVEEISEYGKRLGSNITEFVIKNGMHDLFLSSIPVRYSLYSHMFQWLDKCGL